MNDDDRKDLLDLARRTVEDRLTSEDHLDRGWPPSGVFVTLKKHGELRGCIGYLEARGSLPDTVIEAARAAAFSDPRFPPVNPEREAGDIRFEISLLTPFEGVEDPAISLSTLEAGR